MLLALKTYAASVLKTACEGALTLTEAEIARREGRSYESGNDLLMRILDERRAAQSHKKYHEPIKPRVANLPPLPEGWAWATIEQLLRTDSGLAYGILKPGPEDPHGIPMVRIMDVGEGKMAPTEIMKVAPEVSDQFKRTLLEEGDILLAVMATVGRCVVVPSYLIGANVNRALAVIKPTKFVSSEFLGIALRSPRLQQLFQANKIGSAQPRINLADLRTYSLPLPPRQEQEQIVRIVHKRLSIIDDVEMSARLAKKRAILLRSAILQRIFAGASTTPQGETRSTISTSIAPIARRLGNMTPEELFHAAGFNDTDVDEFFQELKREEASGRIRQLRPDNTAVILIAQAE